MRPTEGKYTVFVGFDARDYNIIHTEVDAKYWKNFKYIVNIMENK